MKIAAIQISPGHNYFGHHNRAAGTHPTLSVESVVCRAGRGLEGDRFLDYKPNYNGQITFFAEETHAALIGELHLPPFAPAAYRRNILTRGADLPALVGQEFELQGVRFLGAGEAKPCYWMNDAAGPGAEKWLRGRGGLRAKILTDGELRVDCPTAGGVLLAGGRGRRMGTDKAALDWQGRPLGEHQAATLAASGAWPLTLSCRPDQPWGPAGFTRLEDRADTGALGALTDALAASSTPVTTFLAIDLPLLTAEFLAQLTGLARERGVSVVPQHHGQFEPLAAAWHRTALPALRDALAAGRSLQEVCAVLAAQNLLQPHVVIDSESPLFANLNTPADLARAR